MRFWLRELAGWLLVLLGLLIFYLCVAIVVNDSPAPLYVSAIFLTIIGVVVYRSGIHLLKVAVAARVCMHAQARWREETVQGRKEKSARLAAVRRTAIPERGSPNRG
ncbi:MAG TPA: hypothetical protein VEL76_38355 [Gemmataceae bacterium]|nr:hypothetical protein [Gemmataceae bacterium]